MVPEEMILILTDLNRTSTILHQPSANTHRYHHCTTRTHLWNQNAITRLDRDLHPLPIFIEAAGPHREDLGLRELLDGGLGEEDARCGFSLGFDPLHEDAVEEGGKGLNRAKGGGL